MAKITVLLSDDQHQRFVNAKMRLKLRSLQELLIESTEAALATTNQGEQKIPDERDGKTMPGTADTTGGDSHRKDQVIQSRYPGKSLGSFLDLTPGELKWVIRLVNILRSGTVAARGIKWNIMMVGKAMGLLHDSQDLLLPRPTRDTERAAREEIAIAERLIAESEADSEEHPRRGKRDRGA